MFLELHKWIYNCLFCVDHCTLKNTALMHIIMLLVTSFVWGVELTETMVHAME
jgi:hypothetical protein